MVEECGCEGCHEKLREYKACPECGGEVCKITHISYDNIYFMNGGEWQLGKEGVRGAYSNRYQCLEEKCGWDDGFTSSKRER